MTMFHLFHNKRQRQKTGGGGATHCIDRSVAAMRTNVVVLCPFRECKCRNNKWQLPLSGALLQSTTEKKKKQLVPYRFVKKQLKKNKDFWFLFFVTCAFDDCAIAASALLQRHMPFGMLLLAARWLLLRQLRSCHSHREFVFTFTIFDCVTF